MCVSCLPVPLQSFIVKPVEEVRLGTERPHVGVDAEKLQQGAGSSFLHADYNRLRKPLGPESVGHGNAVALRALLRAAPHVERQLRSQRVHLRRVLGDCAVPVRQETRRGSQLVQNSAGVVQNVIVGR